MGYVDLINWYKMSPPNQGTNNNYSTAVGFNYDGSSLFSGTFRGTIYTYDTLNGK